MSLIKLTEAGEHLHLQGRSDLAEFTIEARDKLIEQQKKLSKQQEEVNKLSHILNDRTIALKNANNLNSKVLNKYKLKQEEIEELRSDLRFVLKMVDQIGYTTEQYERYLSILKKTQ